MSDRHVFVCPVCGRGSTQQRDAEDGYCGSCHAQTGLPVRLTVGHVSAIIGHLNRVSGDPVVPQLVALLGDIRAVALAGELAARVDRHAP